MGLGRTETRSQQFVLIWAKLQVEKPRVWCYHIPASRGHQTPKHAGFLCHSQKIEFLQREAQHIIGLGVLEKSMCLTNKKKYIIMCATAWSWYLGFV